MNFFFLFLIWIFLYGAFTVWLLPFQGREKKTKKTPHFFSWTKTSKKQPCYLSGDTSLQIVVSFKDYQAFCLSYLKDSNIFWWVFLWFLTVPYRLLSFFNYFFSLILILPQTITETLLHVIQAQILRFKQRTLSISLSLSFVRKCQIVMIYPVISF